jgi:MFS superfamily sulfate permease-like transporter
MTGFLNGVAVLIILGQISDFTGYKSRYSNRVVEYRTNQIANPD